jgi:hypothetical protein
MKKRRKLMSHIVASLKGPAPPVEVMTLSKRVKHLGTLVTTKRSSTRRGPASV